MTERQREILIGLLLGDGHLETQNQGRTYRLKIEHSIKQKSYTDWLYREFHAWVLTPPQMKVVSLNGVTYQKYWFNTVSHGVFRFYAHQFYREKKKVVPVFIKKWLTPLALAIWFMDDGSIKSKQTRSLIFNTQSFSKQDIERLIQALQKIFDISSVLRKQKEGYQIFIPAKEAPRFAAIIAPYVLPEMRYKMKVTYLPKE